MVILYYDDYLVLHSNISQPFNLPNLRRLFVEARTEAEESAYSRMAVSEHPLYFSFMI